LTKGCIVPLCRLFAAGSKIHVKPPVLSRFTPVHINRTLKRLETEGLSARRNSRAVTIGDWNNLADAGDFDSTALA
jgi:hypothetical protein